MTHTHTHTHIHTHIHTYTHTHTVTITLPRYAYCERVKMAKSKTRLVTAPVIDTYPQLKCIADNAYATHHVKSHINGITQC